MRLLHYYFYYFQIFILQKLPRLCPSFLPSLLFQLYMLVCRITCRLWYESFEKYNVSIQQQLIRWMTLNKFEILWKWKLNFLFACCWKAKSCQHFPRLKWNFALQCSCQQQGSAYSQGFELPQQTFSWNFWTVEHLQYLIHLWVGYMFQTRTPFYPVFNTFYFSVSSLLNN